MVCQRRYVSVLYIKGTSERASRILKKFNIKSGSKSSNTLKNQLGNAKQKRNTKDKSNVVYEIDCENCEKKNIGETKKRLEERVKEHICNIGTKRESSLNIAGTITTT